MTSMSDTDTAIHPWQDDIFGALHHAGVRQVAYVPDAGHARLIQRVQGDANIRAIPLTTEEEGVAVACGAWLGGQRAVLLMQSSGVGNCINLFSLIANCRLPFVTLITMRGEWAEFNPWQIPMSRATPGALALMGLQIFRVNEPVEAGEVVTAALDGAFRADQAAAVLLSQRLIGRKSW